MHPTPTSSLSAQSEGEDIFTGGVFVYRLWSISSGFTCTCVLANHKTSGVSSCANTTVKPPEWLPFSGNTSPAKHENMLPASHMWAGFYFYLYEVQVSGRNGTHRAFPVFHCTSLLFRHPSDKIRTTYSDLRVF